MVWARHWVRRLLTISGNWPQDCSRVTRAAESNACGGGRGGRQEGEPANQGGVHGDDACEDGTKFIEYSAHVGQTEMFRLLADEGADLKTRGCLRRSWTGRVDGAGGRNPPAKEIFFYVLEMIDPAREEVREALLYGAAQDDLEIVAACLERGGDANFVDSVTYRFALMNAVERGNGRL